jgi:hypothetical protein
MAEEKVIKIDSKVIENLVDRFEEEKDVEIKSASLKDAVCNYSYELLTGRTVGDILNRRGNHIIHDDLQEAFKKFNVFLAHLDDAYTGNDNSTKLSFLESESETELYTVSSFKITGVEENKAIILSGNKYVTSGVIAFDAPKVKLNGSYIYLSELLEVLANVIEEVEKYMDGKTAPQYEQTYMDFASEDGAFEQGKVI